MKGDMESGGCPMCEKHQCGGMCRQHHWMHVIIKVLVAIFIFWCGFQFGELKGLLHGGYGYGGGYGMMSAYRDNLGQDYFYRTSGGMMNGWAYSAASQATTTKR